MTLIIGYASDEFAILTSDRMITWPTDLYANQVNKSVLFRGVLWGFAGVADMGVKERHTADWLIELLEQVDREKSDYPVRTVREALVKEMVRFTRAPYSRSASQLWSSLMMVGFVDVKRGEPNPADVADAHQSGNSEDGLGPILSAEPMLMAMSNAKDQEYNQARVQNPRKFWQSAPTVTVKNNEFRLWAIGSCPDIEHLERAAQIIRRYRKRHPNQSMEIAKTLLRLTVARSFEDPGVGDTVQVVVVPRHGAGLSYLRTSFDEWRSLKGPLKVPTAFEFNSAIGPRGRLIGNGVAVVGDGGGARGLRWSPGETSELEPPPDFAAPTMSDPRAVVPHLPWDGLARIALGEYWLQPRPIWVGKASPITLFHRHLRRCAARAAVERGVRGSIIIPGVTNPERAKRIDGLTQAMAALREITDQNEGVRIWQRITEVLGWLYRLEEFERKQHPPTDYFKIRDTSNDGQTLGGLIWMRGLVEHHQAEVRESFLRPATFNSIKADGTVVPHKIWHLNKDRIMVESKLWSYAWGWPMRANLPTPDPKYKALGRDLMYDNLVAGKKLLEPLGAAETFLATFT